jgi:hypothetical protein
MALLPSACRGATVSSSTEAVLLRFSVDDLVLVSGHGTRAASRITSTRSRLERARHTPDAAVAVTLGGITFRRCRRRAGEWL